MFKPRMLTLTTMILAAAFARLIPHPWNFTPVASMALFGGACFAEKKFAFVVPMMALILSDLFLGFYSTWAVVYFAFALTVLLGMTLRKNKTVSRIAVVTLSGSIGF